MSVRLICGYQFRLVADLEAERDARRNVVEFDPPGPGGASLSDAPFCRFAFPANLHQGGVYAVRVDDRTVYVGQTNSLSRRFGPGEYGHIEAPPQGSPQVTNRRVNHGILRALQRGQVVQVWFHESRDRDAVERAVIGRLDLSWNRQAPTVSEGTKPSKAHPARSDRASVLRAADAAKALMLSNRAEGELAFRALLADYPCDGIVFLRRGEAHESLGLVKNAADDYRRAEPLLEYPGWQSEARVGLRRVEARATKAAGSSGGGGTARAE